MHTERLLKAARIVAKADPNTFYMSNLNRCIIGQCHGHAGFEPLTNMLDELKRNSYTSDWVEESAKFFGIEKTVAEELFDNGKTWSRHEAAAQIRRIVKDHRGKQAKAKKAREQKRLKKLRSAERLARAGDNSTVGFTILRLAVDEALATAALDHGRVRTKA